MSPARILLVDDHVVFTDGVVQLLKDRFEVVGTIEDGNLLFDAMDRLSPDAIVMDISMPSMSGMEALRRLKARRAETKAIVLTMHADAKLAAEALRLGAKGFVLKQSSGDELITALQAVLQGGTYLTAAVTADVLALLSAPAAVASLEPTPQQREVLRLIVGGKTMKEIAVALDLSTRTVETIKYDLMHSLNLHSTAELVRYAIEHHLVAF